LQPDCPKGGSFTIDVSLPTIRAFVHDESFARVLTLRGRCHSSTFAFLINHDRATFNLDSSALVRSKQVACIAWNSSERLMISTKERSQINKRRSFHGRLIA
jgi:hypothetical protein